MAAQEFRVCPDCGSRNKVKWEFCARCGRAMQDVATGDAGATESDTDLAPPTSTGSILSIVVAILVLAGGVAIWRSGWRLTGPQADPGAFALGIAPSGTPAPTASPASPTAARFAEAQRLAAGGNIDSAIPLFDEVVGDEPRSAQYRAGYGEALWAAGRRERALTQFREAAAIAAVPHRLVLARRLSESGLRAESIREYEGVVAANPGDAVAAAELGTLLNQDGQYARAIEVFRAAKTANPEVRGALALALEKTGDTRGASDIYRQLLDEDSGRALVRANLAYLMVKGGDPQSAVKLCQEGLKLTPDAPLLHTGLGRAYDEMGQWKEAAAEYRESVRLAPNSENAKPLAARAEALEKLAGSGS